MTLSRIFFPDNLCSPVFASRLSEMMIQHYTPAPSFRDPSLLTMTRYGRSLQCILHYFGGEELIHKIHSSNPKKKKISFSHSTILSCDLEASLKRRICSWDFLSLDMTDQELIHCVYLIFEQVLSLPELQHLNLTKGK